MDSEKENEYFLVSLDHFMGKNGMDRKGNCETTPDYLNQ